MAKIYYDRDADLEVLKGKTVGIIGFGSQGRAHALNLRDSGIGVIISELPATPNWDQAKAGFETLVEAGYQPEIAYYETCHEMKLIVDLIIERGIQGMRKSISDTAEYGDMTRGPRIINDSVRKEMKKILAEIRSGEFAREWILENKAGRPVFESLGRQAQLHKMEKIGKKMRDMMPWLKK